MAITELTLLLLLAIAVGGALVHWSPLPLPILLVVLGVVASFLPGLDDIAVDPELFLLLFIPPILFASMMAHFWPWLAALLALAIPPLPPPMAI